MAASSNSSSSSSTEASAAQEGTYLLEGVNQLLKDPSFQLGTERMKKAISAAMKLKEWIPLNMANVIFLEREMLKHFKRCARDGMIKQDAREQFMSRFHHFRSSDAFANLWKVFLTPVCMEVAEDPLFYQYMTRLFLARFMKTNFPVEASDTSSSFALTFEQINAIRYVAGYVCFKLHKKMKDDQKDDLMQGLEEMIDTDKLDKTAPTAKWVNIVDRGGLVHVHYNVYLLFLKMERIIQQILRKDKASDTLVKRKELLLKKVVEDSGVLSTWDDIGVELGGEKKKLLLSMIATLFITIRGFSFAGSYVELYKQSMKKTLQGSKALRTKLNAESTTKDKSEG